MRDTKTIIPKHVTTAGVRRLRTCLKCLTYLITNHWVMIKALIEPKDRLRIEKKCKSRS